MLYGSGIALYAPRLIRLETHDRAIEGPQVRKAQREAPQLRCRLLVAEVLVGLATDTTVYLSRRGEALKVNELTFAHSSWHPGPPGRPLFVEGPQVREAQCEAPELRCRLSDGARHASYETHNRLNGFRKSTARKNRQLVVY